MLPTPLTYRYHLMLLLICLLPVPSARAVKAFLWFDRFMVPTDPDADNAVQVWVALIDGLRFQLQTQFLPEKRLYLEDLSLVLGGFHTSLTNFEVWVDYVQHNICSLLCAYWYFPPQ